MKCSFQFNCRLCRNSVARYMLFIIMSGLIYLSTAFGEDTMKINEIFPQDLKITIVFNNDSYDPSLKTDWGFACVITGLEKTILFDTGADGDILLENMQKLHIKPEAIQIVVLSHYHGDHTGGLDRFLQENSNVTVYLLKSFPEKIKSMVHSRGANMIEVEEPLQICRYVHTTGEITAHVNEQALLIRSDKGLIMVTGCAHPYILSMIEIAKTLFADEILLVMGGWHLRDRTEQQLSEIVNQFRRLGVRFTAPTHCSGDLTRKIFAKEYKDYYLDAGVGRIIKYVDFPGEEKNQ